VWTVRAAIDAHRVARLPGPEAKGRARQAASDRHVAARAAALGFSDLGAYLRERYAERAWPLPRLAGELGTGRRVVARLLRQHGITRSGATAAQAAAGSRRTAARESGRARVWGAGRLPAGAPGRAGLAAGADRS
jgi:hypothetical protein